MPWRFDKLAIEPERIRAMHYAYERVREELGLSDISDKVNESLVAKIVELGTREADPERLCEKVLAYYRQVEK